MLDTSIWNEVKENFLEDGGLRDIYCLGCSPTDQLTLLRFFTNGQFRIVVRDGKRDEIAPTEYPKNIQAYFSDVEDSYLMTVFVGECDFNFWLFSERDYVELDSDADCILQEKEFVAVCEFMKAIGDLISKKVNGTLEGVVGSIFHYDPAAQKMLLDGERRV